MAPGETKPADETMTRGRTTSDEADDDTSPRATEAPLRTGAEQPWDPEDFAVAAGRDPTPENVAWARRRLEEEGPAAIEKTVP